MKTLTIASFVTVLCTVSIWLCTALAIALEGQVDLDERFVVMVVYPTILGLLASLVGAAAGVAILVRRASHGWPGTAMAVGQLLTWALAIGIIVWAMVFPSTGWELIALPLALMLGQVVVAIGLLEPVARRLRGAARRAA
ncbi:hypothetical protein ACFWPA_15975 [Rhodococcus sp. NPDC058505]|uniref:hypothetical protein n=1 Tax=unclassified Rhodococcus (in: high G+C Gram-positive bacteria) TaxID=192944 RepID=UPI003655045C